MDRESSVMKAWREFAMADPENCDREYDAYLALANRKETTAGSSPTNSTSSLQQRAPAAAATRSTAPLSAPSGTTSSPRDPLSPEAQLIYEYIIGNSDEFASRDGLSPGALRHYEYLVGGSATPDTFTTPASTTNSSIVLSVAAELDAVRVAVDIDKIDLTAPTPTFCLSECPSRGVSHLEDVLSSSATTTSSMTTDSVSERCCFDPEPAAANGTSTSAPCLLERGASTSSLTVDWTALNVAPAVEINAAYLALVVPIKCSTDCPSHNDVVSVPMLNSYVKETLADCLGSGIDKQPILLVEAHEVFNEVPTTTEIMPWPPPSWTRVGTPLIRDQDLFQHAKQNCGKDFSVMDSTGNWNAIWLRVEQKPPWTFLGVCMNLPLTLLTQIGVLQTRINCPPWPPPWSPCIQNIHQLDVHDIPPLLILLVESMGYIRGRIEIRFYCFSSQVAELFLICCAACSIPNMYCTMDAKKISGDWLYSTTMELQWGATLTMITFDLGVQCVPLEPTVLKWSDHFCYNTSYLLATCQSMFSDVEVQSLVHPERESWFQFCSTETASLYSYGTVLFQWAIAWPPTTLVYSIPTSCKSLPFSTTS